MIKNIYIQSDSNDISTEEVLSWIFHLEPSTNIVTFFDNCHVANLKVEISNKNFKIKIGDSILEKKSKFWYRRGTFFCYNNYVDKQANKVEEQLFFENVPTLLNFINSSLYDFEINKDEDNDINKLKMLNYCISLNINIPETLVSSNIIDVQALVKKHGAVISKPIRNPFQGIEHNGFNLNFSEPSELITQENIKKFPDKFLPSLFQQYIPKKVEIRAFYFNEKFYSMAIFSQSNVKTKIDFRNYDYENPNRTVPFKLPKKIRKKLKKLLKKANLKSGSFDIILTPENKYVFLEINPIGQFQWLSRNCNYYLEKRIATYLLKQ